MNQTQAKILILCENLRTDLRYAEYISDKLDMNYYSIASYMRKMKMKKWVKFAKTKNKVVVTSVDLSQLEQAKKVMDDVG